MYRQSSETSRETPLSAKLPDPRQPITDSSSSEEELIHPSRKKRDWSVKEEGDLLPELRKTTTAEIAKKLYYEAEAIGSTSKYPNLKSSLVRRLRMAAVTIQAGTRVILERAGSPTTLTKLQDRIQELEIELQSAKQSNNKPETATATTQT